MALLGTHTAASLAGDDTHHDFESRFWASTAAAGGWVTVVMGLSGVSYTVLFAGDAHRLGVGIMIAVTVAVGAVSLWVVPWDRVIASPRREVAFFVWSLVIIAMLAGLAAADGGATSPLALMLVLPTVFAALAYPLRLVLAVSVLAELAFGGLILVGAPTLDYAVVCCSALAGTAALAVWQTANHDVWRAELARSSVTDPLTGLLNRRGFAAATHVAFSALNRQGRQMTLLVLDLDVFKAYNDTHGHQAGDELLQWVGRELVDTLGPTDVVSRLGGDEFAVLLTDTNHSEACLAIGRLEAVLCLQAPHCLGRATAPEHGSTFDDLYRAADNDLYQRKSLGRERVPVLR